MRVACVHHLARPSLGHAEAALAAAGAEVVEVHTRRGDPLPALEELDAIVSFGGEQSVRDLASEPALREEAAWLADAVAREVPLLGICLGAQLLAHALGAEVRKLRRQRLDWAPLRPAAADPLLGGLADGTVGLFWNGDGFDLPPGAVALLDDEHESCSAFRFGERAWGVQFHPEVDGAILDHWYAGWPEIVEAAGADESRARRDDARHLPGQPALTDAIVGGLLRLAAAR